MEAFGKIIGIKNNNQEEYKTWAKTIFITLILGFIIHGTYAFDKTIWFDDAASFGGGQPWAFIQHGRWATAAIDVVMKKLVGTELIALWHIMNSFIVIAIIAMILLDRFKISERIATWALIIYMLSNIAVIGNFGYVGTSAMNFIGILIATHAAILTFDGITNRTIKKIFIGGALLVISLGMYQCFLAYFVTFILLLFVDYILAQEENTIFVYFKIGIEIIGVICIALIIYFVITSIVCKLTNIPLTEYAGTASYGIVGPKEYLERVKYAFCDFFIQSKGNTYSLFPFQWKGWWILLLAVLALMILTIAFIQYKQENHKKCIAFLIINAFLPFANNLIFIMYDSISAHSLHVYQSIFIFFYAVYLGRYVRKNIQLARFLYILVISLVFIFDLLLIKYDNQCYMSIKFAREQSTQFMNRLLSDVYATEGYVDGMEIFIVSMDELANKGIDQSPFSGEVSTNPYNISTFDYTRNDFIMLYNGKQVNIRDLYEGDYDYVGIWNMPKYPSYGSIKVMDDRVIVNL